MNTAEVRALTDAEFDQASGAEPNLGGYSYCHYPREGLYVGPCQNPPDLGALVGAVVEAVGGAVKPWIP